MQVSSKPRQTNTEQMLQTVEPLISIPSTPLFFQKEPEKKKSRNRKEMEHRNAHSHVLSVLGLCVLNLF